MNAANSLVLPQGLAYASPFFMWVSLWKHANGMN